MSLGIREDRQAYVGLAFNTCTLLCNELRRMFSPRGMSPSLLKRLWIQPQYTQSQEELFLSESFFFLYSSSQTESEGKYPYGAGHPVVTEAAVVFSTVCVCVFLCKCVFSPPCPQE